ncbi:hypothetical protein ABIB00_005044 [Bradyrhizobium sp. LB14.3]|uniref:hypothetical protein n=1 Tax=Bradyrhizobium sp. LB14.3 TaxID=3156328 RepID=UPI00339AA15F
MITNFLFMDEKFADEGVPLRARAISLTGILISADAHRAFKGRFYGLVHRTIGDEQHVISPMPVVHAMDLFPGKDDDTRFRFLEGIVQIVADLGFRTYRVGYRPTQELLKIVGDKEGVLGLCFASMLHCLEGELAKSVIWPVMEIDRNSSKQDRSFAGLVQSVDYMTSRLGSASMSVHNDNLGELLYTTKKSAYGSLVDCIAYLLHLRFLRSIGHSLTPFKSRLADIASSLEPVISFDEVIEMKMEMPPAGYLSNGPVRFMVPVTPQD